MRHVAGDRRTLLLVSTFRTDQIERCGDMSGRVFIGTSGWSYDGWTDRFYVGVPRNRRLEHCAEHFSGLEANGTFYRLQSENTLRAWTERTPEDFVFTANGHRYVTHNKKLIDADETVVNSRDNMRPLGQKLAVVVWQLPDQFSLLMDRLGVRKDPDEPPA